MFRTLHDKTPYPISQSASRSFTLLVIFPQFLVVICAIFLTVSFVSDYNEVERIRGNYVCVPSTDSNYTSCQFRFGSSDQAQREQQIIQSLLNKFESRKTDTVPRASILCVTLMIVGQISVWILVCQRSSKLSIPIHLAVSISFLVATIVGLSIVSLKIYHGKLQYQENQSNNSIPMNWSIHTNMESSIFVSTSIPVPETGELPSVKIFLDYMDVIHTKKVITFVVATVTTVFLVTMNVFFIQTISKQSPRTGYSMESWIQYMKRVLKWNKDRDKRYKGRLTV